MAGRIRNRQLSLMLIVQVVAYNRAGLTTTVCSNGFRLDRVGPVIGTISVVEPWRLDDERYSPDGLGSISFTWADFIDLQHLKLVNFTAYTCTTVHRTKLNCDSILGY